MYIVFVYCVCILCLYIVFVYCVFYSDFFIESANGLVVPSIYFFVDL